MERSLLIEDGALPWIVKNANNEAAPIRRHIELALCHLAQHGIFNHIFLSHVSKCMYYCTNYNPWMVLAHLHNPLIHLHQYFSLYKPLSQE